MPTMFSFVSFCRLAAVALLATGTLAFVPSTADAQSVATRYQRTHEREQAARRSKRPTITSLRAIATAYEAIVRRYPTSGYSDNALWQAAGVLEMTYQRTGAAPDREKSVAMLKWLAREYPTSALAKQATTRLAALAPERAEPAEGTRVAVAAPPARPAPETAAAVRPAPPTRSPATAPRTAANAKPAPPAPVTPPAAETPAALATSAPVALESVTYTTLPRGDRITLALSRELSYSANRQESPDRLILSMSDAGAPAEVVEAVNAIRGTHIGAMKLAAAGSGGIQVQLQLKGHPRYSAFPLYDPYRLVIDVESETPTAMASGDSAPAVATAVARTNRRSAAPETAARNVPAPLPVVETPEIVMKPAPPSSTSSGGYSLARQLGLGVSRIVIDPGHGGNDPGAQANGVTESELVLDVALRLEKLLQAQPGFEVVLTRRTNQAVALEERTAIANRESADLFLSIHANSSPRRETRGIETYILNFASNSHAESVAARENASSAQTMRILPEIVKAIALNNKLAESRELATLVQGSLVRRLKEQNTALMDLGVKQAPFVVLIGAQMPSVLAEIAFLTNRTEASLLKQGSYRQRFAQSLCDAILKYQSSLKKVTSVATTTGAR